MHTLIRLATKPMDKEMRAPYRTRTNKSRPSASVPNQCSRDGQALAMVKFCASYVYGDSHGPTTANTVMTATIAMPQRASRFFFICRQPRSRSFCGGT